MVFFNCEACNETLKKNQVEKHFYKCRTSGVTCIDCSVTFYGSDYAGHTSCISEAEKYEKSLYKGGNKKKLNPQDAWVMVVEHAGNHQEQAPTAIRPYLSRLAELGNVPRNKKKFNNFVKNSLKIYNDKVVEDIFNHLEMTRNELCSQEEKKNETANTSESMTVAEVNSIEDNVVEELEEDKKHQKEKKQKKEKKHKRKRETEDNVEEEVVGKKNKKNKKKHNE